MRRLETQRGVLACPTSYLDWEPVPWITLKSVRNAQEKTRSASCPLFIVIVDIFVIFCCYGGPDGEQASFSASSCFLDPWFQCVHAWDVLPILLLSVRAITWTSSGPRLSGWKWHKWIRSYEFTGVVGKENHEKRQSWGPGSVDVSLSKERKMIPIRVLPLSLRLLLVANPLGIILLTACILSEFLSDLLLWQSFLCFASFLLFLWTSRYYTGKSTLFLYFHINLDSWDA